MSEEKLNSLVEKIDPLIETINKSSKYSEAKKVEYANILTALKEVIQDRTSSELDINSLFN
jgi:hypothetical protein